ncbi:MAG: hypothetical protein ACI8Y4_004985 [Candidatus Poriferisodalaceae bacterium]|jgi:hypothetical protein
MQSSEPRQNESGIAIITVLTGGLVIFLALIMMMRNSVTQYENARFEEREDVMLAQMEAVSDRYMSKLHNDAAYHFRWVDEFERTRTCTDATDVVNYLTDRAPGQAWFPNCGSWSYTVAASAEAWRRHPLTTDDDDGVVLLEVHPGADRGYLELEIAGQIERRGQWRAMSVEIFPPSVSGFQWMSELDLRFTPGAETQGPVYSGNDVIYSGPAPGNAMANVLADGEIVEAPTFVGAAAGFDSGGTYSDIRDKFPEELVFDDFWDDISLLQTVACDQGGLCLNSATATAYMIHPIMQGATPKLSVWSASVANSNGCLEGDEWWWQLSNSAVSGWSPPIIHDYPSNGVVWANGPVIVGNRSLPGQRGAVVVGDPLTIVAGTIDTPRDIVIGGSISYANANDDVIGLVATGDLVIDPQGTGQVTPGVFTIHGAFLAMEGQLRVARSCGRWGALLDNAGASQLEVVGAIATRNTGDLASYFVDRDYSFDPRFFTLAPPFFPRVAPNFSFVDWREVPIPDWAKG